MSKDVLLISMFPKQETNYADHYISRIKEIDFSYDIVYFERYDIEGEPEENEIIFSKYCPTGGSKIKKICTMLEYAIFIRKILNKNRYSRIIMLSTVPAIMCFDILLKRYQKKYVLDIRDYTYEINKLYYSIEKNLIKYSNFTVISSIGFKTFLPSNVSYVNCHNIPLEYSITTKEKKLNDTIRIGYVGSIRYYGENTTIITQLANNRKYSLHYFGNTTNDCDLESYCNSKDIKNVLFYGKYSDCNKKDIYGSIDIINCIYGDKNLETKTLTPHRLYDSAIYRCPIVVSKNTHLEKLVKQYNIGFSVDLKNDDLDERITKYLNSFDFFEFEEGCNSLLEKVKLDMTVFYNKIDEFLRN